MLPIVLQRVRDGTNLGTDPEERYSGRRWSGDDSTALQGFLTYSDRALRLQGMAGGWAGRQAGKQATVPQYHSTTVPQ